MSEGLKFMPTAYRLLLSTILITFLGMGFRPDPIHIPETVTEPTVSTINTPLSEIRLTTPATAIPDVPYDLISQESLFAYLEDLTSIQAYSGWRNSASSGEAEALDYVAGKLNGFSKLQKLGLELERQSFNVYLSTEIWDSNLTLNVNNKQFNVPADSLRGSRFIQQYAAYFDSNGGVNDSNRDPMTASGAPLVVRDEHMLFSLPSDELKGRILFIDYSLLDNTVNGAGAGDNGIRLADMVDLGLAGVVLLTQYSNKAGESHGTFVGEGAIFGGDIPSKRIPFLYVRIEDLSPTGIETWEDIEQIESARLIVDSDVFLPGKSGNLIAHIPGADSSKAVILGAHIDSPNSPGAFDDGSGSATLLEIARVLDVSQIQPPVDVYLAWFGSEELGLYGSAYFTSTHQELLDRTLAMIQMDCLGYPLQGKTSDITMTLTSYDRFGDNRLPLPDYLSTAVAAEGIDLDLHIDHGIESDHNSFDAFNVPNVSLIYENSSELNLSGRSIAHAIHIHDAYETVERARAIGDVYVEMTKVMLAAALDIGRAHLDLRNSPTQDRRALFIASHTESFGIPSLRELGMALALEGFDVDLIPYGQAIIPTDLINVDVIVLPPALNSPGRPVEKWSQAEIALLQDYVADGGLLVVVNSAYNYVSTITLDSSNKNARSINALLEPMGFRFKYGDLAGDSYRTSSDCKCVLSRLFSTQRRSL
jgi:hypothetical protein